ncbi:nicotinamide riboside transporter PnuC [Chitinophagaceae bacterium LWZ2-11]
MFLRDLLQAFTKELSKTTIPEFVGVICGIGSVYFSRLENILVYPVGMISTTIYIYLYIKHGLYADASVNFYYTVMSVIGWVMWTRKKNDTIILKITKSSRKEHVYAIFFFIGCWGILFLVLKNLTDSTVPWADSFTSAAAFTGMLLMNKKKIENWFWWTITNIASIPLNFYKGLAFTSFQYMVLLVIALMGWVTWAKRMKESYK